MFGDTAELHSGAPIESEFFLSRADSSVAGGADFVTTTPTRKELEVLCNAAGLHSSALTGFEFISSRVES